MWKDVYKKTLINAMLILAMLAVHTAVKKGCALTDANDIKAEESADPRRAIKRFS